MASVLAGYSKLAQFDAAVACEGAREKDYALVLARVPITVITSTAVTANRAWWASISKR